jgi:hypothetical protein
MSIGVKYSLFFPLVFVKHAQEFSSRDLSLYKKKFSKRAKSFFKQTKISQLYIVEIRMSNCVEMASQLVVKRKALPKQ